MDYFRYVRKGLKLDLTSLQCGNLEHKSYPKQPIKKTTERRVKLPFFDGKPSQENVTIGHSCSVVNIDDQAGPLVAWFIHSTD